MINLQAEHLGHLYGDHRALVDVSFDIEQGSVVGLVGPNGAGKSTTMKILTGFLVPSFGSAKVAGIDIVADRLAAQRHVGYLPESAPLYKDMVVQEYLDYMARLKGVAAADRRTRLGFVVSACSLRDVLTKPIHALSKGYRQRVGLAQAMVHDPSILILDEPTSGLDPNQILEIRDVIRDLGRSKTVVLSTHVLSEVEAMCGRAIVIVGGAVHADVPVGGAQGEAEVVVLDAPDGLGDALARIPGVKTVKAARNGATSTFRLATGGDARAVLEPVGRLCADKRCVVTALGTAHTDLEEIFRKLQGARGAAKEAVS